MSCHMYIKAASIRVFSVSSCSLGYRCFMNFVSLRSISLSRVEIYELEVTKMVGTCLLLESLRLVECYRLSSINFDSKRSRLNRLVVKHCKHLTNGLKLSLPGLEYFEYAGKLIKFDLRDLDALHEVVLIYEANPYTGYDLQSLRQLFHGFSSARILKLYSTALIKMLSIDQLLSDQCLSQMMQTQHLQFTTKMGKHELPAILFLIKNSPLLRTLSITGDFTELTPFQEYMYRCYPKLPEEIWETEGWNLNHLEELEVDGYTGKKNESDFLKLILKSSQSLQIVKIKPLASDESSSTSAQALKHLRIAACEYGNAVIIVRS